MTVTTVYADAADNGVRSSNATYATARSGSNLLLDAVGNVNGPVGQLWDGSTYYCWELFYSFDTSSIPDADTISAAVLSLYGNTNGSDTDFTVQARDKNWGAAVDTGDFVAGASLGGQTLLATFNTSGFSTAAYNDFTESGSALRSWVNKTGTSYLLLNSDRHAGNTTPTGNEWVYFWMADQTGTSNDPKLVVTHGTTTYTQSVGGTLTPAGSLVKQPRIAPTGTLNCFGLLGKRVGRSLGGTLSPSSTLTAFRVTLKSIGGTLSPTGALSLRPLKALGGALSPTGTLQRQVRKALLALIRPEGTVFRVVPKFLSGVLGLAGTVVHLFAPAPPAVDLVGEYRTDDDLVAEYRTDDDLVGSY